MLNQKVKQTELSKVKEIHGFKSVEELPLDDKLMAEMLEAADTYKYMEEIVNIYADEEPEKIEWIDVEGEGYGWLWLDKPKDTWHGLIKQHMVDYLEYVKVRENQDLLTVLKITYEIEDSAGLGVRYHIIDREVSKEDILYSFQNEEFQI